MTSNERRPLLLVALEQLLTNFVNFEDGSGHEALHFVRCPNRHLVGFSLQPQLFTTVVACTCGEGAEPPAKKLATQTKKPKDTTEKAGVFPNTQLDILKAFTEKHPWDSRPSIELILRAKDLAAKLVKGRGWSEVLAKHWGVTVASIDARLYDLRKRQTRVAIKARFAPSAGTATVNK